MKNRFVIVAASALAALAAGSASAYWFLNQQSLGSRGLPVGVEAIPHDALMTITVSTNDEQWEQFRKLGTDESQARLDAFLNEWRDRLLTDNGITYRDDIQPWVGDTITIAVMGPTEISIPNGLLPDSENDESNGASDLAIDPEAPILEDTPELETDSNVSEAEDSEEEALDGFPSFDTDLIDPTQNQAAILFLPVADPVEAQNRLKNLIASGNTPTQREYQGITIQTFQHNNTDTYEVAAFDRELLVVTTQENVIDEVIDTYQGESSIADVDGYEAAIRSVSSSPAFAQAYVNVPVARAIAAANATEAAQSRNLVPWQNMQGVAATATLNPSGVNVRSISWLLPDSEPLQLKNQGRSQLAERFPDSTLMMISGSNLEQQWELYSLRNEEGTEGIFSPQYLREASQTQLGLELETDLLSWMRGEFALGLASTNDEASNLPSAGLVFMVEASDQALAQQTLSNLDSAVEEQYRFRVNSSQLDGQSVIQWQFPVASLSLTRGWLDEKIAFIGFDSITKAIVPNPTASLASSELFRQATASQPKSNTGYFFINVEEFIQERHQLPVPSFPPEQAALVNAIRAIGVTISAEGDRQRRYDISVVTKADAP
ncbi:MAG: DUF3352 domain-containing protein [Cyanobacteria bacterium P01_A01_bin.37]